MVFIFDTFSRKLYKRLAAREYLPHAQTAGLPISDAAYWTMAKREGASICYLRVIDCARRDIARIREEHDRNQPLLNGLLEDYKSVFTVFVLVFENKSNGPDGAGAEDSSLREWLETARAYHGQPVYDVFWRVYLDEKIIENLPGQPKELFGLRALMEKAMEYSEEKNAEAGHAGRGYTEQIYTEAEGLHEVNELSGLKTFKGKNKAPICSIFLIAINAVTLLFMYLNGYASDPIAAAYFGAIIPGRVFAGEYYRLFTAMFIHFGIAHLFMNAMGIFIFGPRIERYFGHIWFLLIYAISGLCASVFSLFFTRGFAAGASGAVCGLLGAALSYTFKTKRSIGGLSLYLILVYIAVNIAFGALMPGIDNFAHIGGMLMGFGLGLAVRGRFALD